eukprot:gene33103-biopygen18655
MPSVAAATATPIPRRGRSLGGAQADTCPDGSAGLTRALYEGGDPATYANVTCIPKEEFQDYEGSVVLKGLALLTSIEEQAFYGIKGTLVIAGEYPSLETVGKNAFSTAGNTESKVDLSGLNSAKLKSIHFAAFNDFKGNITLPAGPFPNYTGGRDVTLDTGLESLHSIGVEAFVSFKGRLTIAGEYPALETVGEFAFFAAGTIESAISFSGLPLLKAIATEAFYEFEGRLTITGEYPSLETVGGLAFESAGNTKSA